MDWNGFLFPLLHAWFPWMPEAVLLAVLGLVVSIITAIFKPKVLPGATARPAFVVAPALVGGVLAGPIGILAPAIGDGLRRAGWTLFTWIARKIGFNA